MAIEELKRNVAIAEQDLSAANSALRRFEQLAENNVYESLEHAHKLKEILWSIASDDCEGSNCCGDDWYERLFTVDGITYTATLQVEYNRHDKTYYYIDSSKFSIVKNNS